MFAGFLQRAVLGPRLYLKQSDLDKMTRRTPFSSFLNYLAYYPDLEVFLNQDGSLGMLWECSPVIYAGPKTITSLEGLFRAGLPKGSVIQLIFHADSHITPILQRYQQNRTRKNPLVESNTEAVVTFLTKGKKGLKACSNIPVRNFRLFVAVNLPGECPDLPSPEDLLKKGKTAPLLDIKRQIKETLKAALLYPRHMQAEDLLEWSRRLFNHYPKDYPTQNFNTCNPEIPLNKQIINSDTVIKEEQDHLVIGDHYFCCTTPKIVPKEIDPLQTNSLFGGIWGVVSDADQIKTDFLYTFNIVFEAGLEMKLHAKCNLILNQQAVGSLSPSLRRKQEEYLSATDDLERGEKFVKVIPVFWVWHDDLEQARDSCTRVRRLWENNGYVMQQDHLILKILFLSALPFGLYTTGRNIENLERDFIAPITSVAPILPVQGDFAGSGGEPKLIFTGRKGQLISLDFFHSGATNQNVFCCATSGSGKSFLVNFIAFNYYACGALVRIIDIGGSYKKMANMFGARFLDFQPDTHICLNPFTSIREPEEELKSVAAVFAQMAYSNSDSAKCDDTEMNLIRNSVRWAWQQKGQEADADTVYEFLMKFPEAPGSNMDEMADNPKLIETARKLAFNIREFTSHGFHGRFFTGPSTFAIHNDEFVVLELENLKVQPDLYRVVTLLIINAVTQDLYLSDRSRPRLIIFDEAWQFLDKGAMIAPVINEGYRRARKYNGSFMVITQSLLDLDNFGEVGSVINSNSAFKILLESTDFDQANKKGLLDYDEFTMRLLKSVKSNPPNYSEIFFDTPFGVGVARLVVNDYAYFIYTSKAREIAMIEHMVQDGKTYHEAIQEMVRMRQQGEL
ncbi:TraC family protein [Desulforhopalus sp. IMCC35007]|uniref:TraC family protein n=1 Tax=Desulforhopalus sp. IMCC35007 TaxID=2569543 RepID=UPI0010AE1CBA|nr:TraC family protein [Desulforhopalus sp. IMCC35007]TKB11276.1 conjugal transfer protein TraC [Desulforhopalus sp. IMCC35007]